MNQMRFFSLTYSLLIITIFITQVSGANATDSFIKDVNFEQKLGSRLSLETPLLNEQGKEVPLGQYFKNGPVVLVLSYFSCKHTCTLVMNGLIETLHKIHTDHKGPLPQVLMISIDPQEGSFLAKEKKLQYLLKHQPHFPGISLENTWHFLTASQTSIKNITEEAGFRYKALSGNRGYIHSTGIVVLSPQAKITQYLLGIKYAPEALIQSLALAKKEEVGGLQEKLILLCSQLDEYIGPYSTQILKMLNVLCFLLAMMLITFILHSLFVEKRKKRKTHLALFPLFPVQASSLAPDIDLMYITLTVLSTLIVLGLALALVYFVFKFHASKKTTYGPPPKTKIWLEATWIAIPLVVVTGVFIWSTSVFYKATIPPAGALEILVVGKQWMWKFQHQDGPREIDQLHVPIGKDVRLTMISQDVIHSLFVPAFRIKQDVLPNRYTTLWFRATQAGTYHLFCAEYCGTLHSRMTGKVVVLPEEEYIAWLESQKGPGQSPPPATSGEVLFQQMGCRDCHNSQLENPLGPDLTGIFGKTVELQNGQKVLVDENYIRESILEPNKKIVKGYSPVMPSFAGQLGEEEILELISYIKSLQEGDSTDGP